MTMHDRPSVGQRHVGWIRAITGTLVALLTMVLGACQPEVPDFGAPTGIRSQSDTGWSTAAIDDFQIVDCLLPGRVKRLGHGMTYMSARRPVRTTGRDCALRQGEYVAYDPANYATALKIWQPVAQQGDPRAQTYVGDIFEHGTAGLQDYAKAARWYHQAAQQGHASAQLSLGRLYEQGLGVAQDRTIALDLYRQATGLGDEVALLPAMAPYADDDNRQSAAVATDEVKRRLEEVAKDESRVRHMQEEVQAEHDSVKAMRLDLQAREKELDWKRQEIDTGRAELEAAAAAKGNLPAELAELAHLHEQLVASTLDLNRATEQISRHEADLAQKENKIAELDQRIALLKDILSRRDQQLPPDPSSFDFGKFHALVIGNGSYPNYGGGSLRSATADADAVAALLEQRYGYEVIKLIDAKQDEILQALSVIKSELTSSDNLLIYYAGHGELDKATGRGYWIPVDVDPYGTKRISTTDIADTLRSMKAKHVMVIADSCYAGALIETVMPPFSSGTERQRTEWIRFATHKLARMALTSGGLSPVLDGGGGLHSIFAAALLEELGTNQDIMEGAWLYWKIVALVSDAAKQYGVEQNPTYSVIDDVEYGGGDYFFVPRMGHGA